jgi:hypothetical protein
MFLVLIVFIVLGTLFFSISMEGFSAREYREKNQVKYDNYEFVKQAYEDYQRILDLKL